jgi:hypothetical protein
MVPPRAPRISPAVAPTPHPARGRTHPASRPNASVSTQQSRLRSPPRISYGKPPRRRGRIRGGPGAWARRHGRYGSTAALARRHGQRGSTAARARRPRPRHGCRRPGHGGTGPEPQPWHGQQHLSQLRRLPHHARLLQGQRRGLQLHGVQRDDVPSAHQPAGQVLALGQGHAAQHSCAGRGRLPSLRQQGHWRGAQALHGPWRHRPRALALAAARHQAPARAAPARMRPPASAPVAARCPTSPPARAGAARARHAALPAGRTRPLATMAAPAPGSSLR